MEAFSFKLFLENNRYGFYVWDCFESSFHILFILRTLCWSFLYACFLGAYEFFSFSFSWALLSASSWDCLLLLSQQLVVLLLFVFSVTLRNLWDNNNGDFTATFEFYTMMDKIRYDFFCIRNYTSEFRNSLCHAFWVLFWNFVLRV